MPTAKPDTSNANTPAQQTVGYMSIPGRLRSATEKPAKAACVTRANIMPIMPPPSREPATMMPTPIRADRLAIHVAGRTRSPSTSQPSTAALSGLALRIKATLATLACNRAKT